MGVDALDDVIGEDGEGSGGPAKAGAASSPAP
jgi:hypothetical protein